MCSSDVKTGLTVLTEPADAEVEEWKRALVVAALVERAGGIVRIPLEEIVRLKPKVLRVYHDHYSDELVLQVGIDTYV